MNVTKVVVLGQGHLDKVFVHTDLYGFGGPLVLEYEAPGGEGFTHASTHFLGVPVLIASEASALYWDGQPTPQPTLGDGQPPFEPTLRGCPICERSPSGDVPYTITGTPW